MQSTSSSATPERQQLRQEVLRACPSVDLQILDELFTQLDPDYFTLFTPEEIATHVTLLAAVDDAHPIHVRMTEQTPSRVEVLIGAYDLFGEFSMLTGLMAAYGLNIREGQVFSYQRGPGRTAPWGHTNGGLIIDVFLVEPMRAFDETIQADFCAQVGALIQLLREGHLQEARDRLNYQLIETIRTTEPVLVDRILPVDLRIDNDGSEEWTIVHLTAEDTPGFLYSLSNALAMRNMYIHRVSIQSDQGTVHDRLDIGWRRGGKIRSPEGLQELQLIVTLIKQFTSCLTAAPDPAKALRHFDQLMDRLTHDGSLSDAFPWLWEAESLQALATVLGSSDFLWEDYLRRQYATLLPVLQETTGTSERPSHAELGRQLHHALEQATTIAERKKSLNTFKDCEMFRIDMRHLLHPEHRFGSFSSELTELTEVVLDGALALAQHHLDERYGPPLLPDGRPCTFALFGLGKFGGRELGYASDIEMLCVYSGQGTTSGPQHITASEYAEQLVRQLLDLIVARRAGIFEIDLRLRPFGSHGPLATSLGAFGQYYCTDGQAAPFERQALIKLRYVAGDATLGERVEQLRDAFVYSAKSFDLAAAMRLRQQQITELTTPGKIDAKYSRGGLIDIEYTVQYLQLLHGAALPACHTPNTLEALHALHEAGYVDAAAYEQLHDAYVFLRHLIDALRIVRGHARDLVLPAPEAEESLFLARRMGYWEDRQTSPAYLLRDITYHMERMAQFYHDRFVATQQEAEEAT